MGTRISAMLAVSDGNAAVEFYRAAFGATVLWDLEGEVAGLAIDGAPFFPAHESPPHGTRGPASAGFTHGADRALRGRPCGGATESFGGGSRRAQSSGGTRVYDDGSAADSADAPRRRVGSVRAFVADWEDFGVRQEAGGASPAPTRDARGAGKDAGVPGEDGGVNPPLHRASGGPLVGEGRR
jgi:hypothetical protein